MALGGGIRSNCRGAGGATASVAPGGLCRSFVRATSRTEQSVLGAPELPSITETLDRAVGHHRAGQLAEADALYRQVLQADPNNAQAWHLLGVVANQVGQYEGAAQCIG